MGRKKKPASTYGQGSIYKDPKSGRWIVQVPLGNGRTIRRRAATFEAAEVVKADLIRRRDKGIQVQKGSLTVADFAMTWYHEVKVPAGLKPKTLEYYRSQLEHYICPAMGTYALEDLKPEVVQRFVNHLRERLSEESVKHAYSVLRRMLDVAVNWQYIESNPARRIERPKVTRKEPKTPTMVEARAFLDSIVGHRFEALYHLAITLGMRRGELLGLRWMDINWVDSTLQIRQQLIEVDHAAVFATPKSESSKRTLPLTPRLVVKLRAHWARQQDERSNKSMSWKEHGLVFPNKNGIPLLPISITKQFNELVDGTPIADANLHLLRHVAASSLAEIGTSEAVIGAILGHTGGSITRRYIQVTLPTMRKAIEDVERALWAPSSGGQKDDSQEESA